MPSIDRAILLSGGLGTRLRGLFPDIPKALAPILGKPFIEHQINWLHSQGIQHVHIAAGYMADSIEAWFQHHNVVKANVTLSRESKPLGTGGAIKYAVQFVPASEHYLVLNGDTLLPNLSIQGLFKAHQQRHAGLTMAVTEIPDASRYGTVVLNDQMHVVSFVEKSTAAGSGFVNGGVYCIRNSTLDLIPDNEACSLEKEIFSRLVHSNAIMCERVSPPLLDMGTPEGHAAMTEFLKKRGSI
jgi:NDP-sugar pyrophosphorylase family protein